MEVKELERALNYAKSVHVGMGYTVLSDAVERFLKAQAKASPAKEFVPTPITVTGKPETPKQQPQPSSPDLSEFIERVREMKKSQPKGCPLCGQHGAHFCTGPHTTTLEYIPSKHGFWTDPRIGTSMGTGIEYLRNQPTAMSNFDTHPRRNEILAQLHGLGVKGNSNAHFTGSGRVTEGSGKVGSC